MITIAFIALLMNLFYASLLNGYRKQWNLMAEPRINDSHLFPSVTLVIPFRNELKNLPEILKCVKSIDYPAEKLAIIFVNDHSDDGSEKLVVCNDIPFQCEIINSLGSGKKAALTTGIEHASAEWILTTDADVVFDPLWIKKMFSIKNLSEAEMICGMVLLRQTNTKPTMLGRFQEMEFDMLQASAMAALNMHQPLLNSGANLAFKKKTWEELGGYESHSKIMSGDDTFLMFAMHEKFGDVIVGNVSSKVKTNVAPDSKSFLQQRRRWAMKGKYYKSKYVQSVGIIVLLSSILIPFLYFKINDPEIGMILATAIILRAISEIRLITKTKKISGQTYQFVELLGMSLFYPFFLLYLAITAPFNKTEWKGRKL